MNKKLTDLGAMGKRGAALIALALLAGGFFFVGCAKRDTQPLVAASEYYCPMHPQVVSEKPGECPICGMDLVAREKAAESAPPPESASTERPRAIELTPEAVQAAGVATVRAERKAMARTVRAAGTVEAAETGLSRIAARVAGRLDRLYLNYTGETVGKGDPIYAIYSPELVSAQREYL